MKLGDIDWNKVHADYAYLVQHVEEGVVYTCSQDYLNKRKDNLVVLAKRPKPALTKEQIEAVRKYHRSLQFDSCVRGVTKKGLEKWLKQRGGEHE